MDSNKELYAIGIANIGGSFASAIPTCGSFSRTSLNAKAGCKTKLSGLISTSVICLSLLLLNDIFFWIPISAIAGVVISAVVGLVNITDFKIAWDSNPGDFIVMTVTFVLTVMVETSIGLFAGIFCEIVRRGYVVRNNFSLKERHNHSINDYVDSNNNEQTKSLMLADDEP